MDLQEFIATTLSEIVKGLGRANDDLGEDWNVGIYSPGKSDQRHVEFDIAVTASSTSAKGGKVSGGIKVFSIVETGGEIGSISEISNSKVSRIKFGVRLKDEKAERKKSRKNRF